MAIEVVRWVSFDEAKDLDCILDGIGGIPETPSREEYLEMAGTERAPYVEAIWSSFDATDRDPPTGTDHQESMCPVFSDGKSAAMSCRAWGDLCAVWWNERHPDARVNYCKFAW